MREFGKRGLLDLMKCALSWEKIVYGSLCMKRDYYDINW